MQRHAAVVLGVGMHQVEVDVTRLGGGFGGKEDQATPWGCLAALGAFLTKKPVKMVLDRAADMRMTPNGKPAGRHHHGPLVLDRAADMRMTGKRHPYSSDFKIGLSQELKIMAYEVTYYQDAGAAADPRRLCWSAPCSTPPTPTSSRT